jgi:SAM-dependent methyltransferase
MSSHEGAVSGAGTTAEDYSDSYYKFYNQAHLETTGSYGWETPHWRTFFTKVADRIIGLVEPETVLDVGCAKGMLVQALVLRGVDAEGFDLSPSAVASAHPDVRHRLRVASATEPIEKRYDLITCVEVLEHLSPEDAQRAIDVLCAASDRILFSSSPGDFDEATHINTHPTAQWAAWFAERGYYRRVDADVSFLASWAVLFERADLSRRSIVERYETYLAPLTLEAVEKRQALLQMHRQLTTLASSSRVVELDDDAILARHAQLTARDHVVGLEARVARLEHDLRTARTRLKRLRERLEDRNNELKALRQSSTWRAGRLITGPVSRLRR